MSVLDPRCYWAAGRESILLLRKHWQLTMEMTRREIVDRYAGQMLGTFWAVGHPLALMAVYLFLFAVVFKVRVAVTGRDVPYNYVVYLLSGLIPWIAFQDSMAKNASIVVAHSNLVKQVVFPVEILPVKSVLVSALTQVICTAVLLVYITAKFRFLPWTYLLLPVLMLCQVMAMIGVGYILSSLGVYFRDLKDFVIVFCLMALYLMPTFYLPEMVPRVFRFVLYANPFSYMIWCYQDACYYGAMVHPWAWGVTVIGSLFIFAAGSRMFRALKPMFSNVL